MTAIVKGHIPTIIFVYAGCGNNRSAKVTSDIFYHSIRVTFIRLGIYVKAVLIITVTESFGFLKRRTYYGFHFIEKGSAECISEIGIIEMPDIFPETIVTETALGQKTMNVRVPFEVASKCEENHNELGSVVFGFVHLIEQSQDDTGHCMKRQLSRSRLSRKKGADAHQW